MGPVSSYALISSTYCRIVSDRISSRKASESESSLCVSPSFCAPSCSSEDGAGDGDGDGGCDDRGPNSARLAFIAGVRWVIGRMGSGEWMMVAGVGATVRDRGAGVRCPAAILDISCKTGVSRESSGVQSRRNSPHQLSAKGWSIDQSICREANRRAWES